MSLASFAILAACVLVIARVGFYFGARGAFFSVATLWVAATSLLQFSLAGYDKLWPELLDIAAVLWIPFGLISVPMLLLKNSDWLRGRIIGGLAGALVVAFNVWLTAPNLISR